MKHSQLRKFLASGLAGVALTAGVFAAVSAANAAQQSSRVRGTVVSLSGSQLEVKTREGQAQTVQLKDGWKVAAVKKAAISDIKPGDFVGIASLPKAEGGDGALEVLIFPPALKGTGEGSYGWDLKPNSSMTNATVGDAVQSVDGSVVTVSYHGQQKKISIPNGTPVVTLAPATADDVKPGTAVFISAEKDAGGALSTGQLVVGKDGVVPPM
ncbi:hypothetical protein [Bordetella genomosp. 13]|uniref:hypothetical protein n=1 Tax=Bordetella genomosp. 13 TaxID=463040 RepID=UPI0011A303A7|nr:hypothetical protein [Bordetella genomosp. 13]